MMSSALEVALQEYGTWEWQGGDHNPRILQYFSEIGHNWVKDDETAWCAAFINWCLFKAGMPHTGRLDARSFLGYGEETEKPVLGDLAIFWRIREKSVWGHVGFYISESPSYVYILSGNQNNQVNIQPYPKSRLLGYRTY